MSTKKKQSVFLAEIMLTKYRLKLLLVWILTFVLIGVYCRGGYQLNGTSNAVDGKKKSPASANSKEKNVEKWKLRQKITIEEKISSGRVEIALYYCRHAYLKTARSPEPSWCIMDHDSWCTELI